MRTWCATTLCAPFLIQGGRNRHNVVRDLCYVDLIYASPVDALSAHSYRCSPASNFAAGLISWVDSTRNTGAPRSTATYVAQHIAALHALIHVRVMYKHCTMNGNSGANSVWYAALQQHPPAT